MKNMFIFTKTLFNADAFLEATDNKYRFVAQKPYYDKSGKTGIQGTTLTLSILVDHADYGVDKNTGEQRDNNQYENFDVTILNGQTHLDLKKGDIVALKDYDSEHSHVVNFDIIMRFKGYEKLKG